MEDFPIQTGPALSGTSPASAPSGPAISPEPVSPPVEAPETPQPPEIDDDTFWQAAAYRSRSDPGGFHKRLTTDAPEYNDHFQQIVHKGVQTDTAKAVEQMQLRQEREAQLQNFEQHWAGLSSEAKAQVIDDDAAAWRYSNGQLDADGYTGLVKATRDWRTNRAEAPTRTRIVKEEIDKALTGLREDLASASDLKDFIEVAEDWTKLQTEALAEGEGAGAYRAFLRKVFAVGAKKIEARLRREFAAEMKAQVSDQVAERTLGLPEPISNGHGVSGVSGGSFASLDDARAAHAAGEISNDAMRRLLARAR